MAVRRSSSVHQTLAYWSDDDLHVMLANQLNTLPDPLLTPMYARKEKQEQKKMATYGRPDFDVREKILGALPESERPSIGMKLNLSEFLLSLL